MLWSATTDHESEAGARGPVAGAVGQEVLRQRVGDRAAVGAGPGTDCDYDEQQGTEAERLLEVFDIQVDAPGGAGVERAGQAEALQGILEGSLP